MTPWPARILVHDYPGHPFQLRLSRRLAERGHQVLHLSSADVETPKGETARRPGDPPGLELAALSSGRPLDKYRFIRRSAQELAYGVRLFRHAVAWKPDLILSAAPPFPMIAAVLAGRVRRVPVVAWVQDVFCLGMVHVARSWPAWKRIPVMDMLRRLELAAIRASAGRVLISPDFREALERIGLPDGTSAVIENWAPLEGAPPPRDNDWARRNGLVGRFVFLVSGTLGLKHNPNHLLNLARRFRDDDRVRVVVVSQGLGRALLEEARRAEGLDNLLLLDFQPLEQLGEVLASADVAVMLLEPFAGELSVPSKVYSYLWAERPILAAVPAANLAHRKVRDLGAGLCVEPADEAGFIAAAERLYGDESLRRSCARAMATHGFDIDRTCDAFLDLFRRARPSEPHSDEVRVNPR